MNFVVLQVMLSCAANVSPCPKPRPRAKAVRQKNKKEQPKKVEKPKTPSDIIKKLPKSPMVLDVWKKVYSCSDKSEAGKMAVMDEFFNNFDAAGYGVWKAEYNYDSDNTLLWKTGNLVEGVCA